ncbi:hypothetical protein PIB30_025049 [Stylosanthes scabra]|uniref:Nucleoside phosphorylase domain-containing protein n=1 Tax=Stylosanthes scabra TaxID=79078 RepID=A0ABU6SAN3_9FABA|nr:hypothetical protein [Stylosanthes scabra]
MGVRRMLFIMLVSALFMLFNSQNALVSCALSSELQAKINAVNEDGPYIGLVIPNSFELDPLLNNSDYISSGYFIDVSGRRFHFGVIGQKPVILVITGLGMINAGITTQILLSNFNIEGVVHYGIAGNANEEHHIGDVAISHFWGHLGLWSWQRNGLGPQDKLPFEENGDYTRKYGYLRFADYTTSNDSVIAENSSYDNLLNNIYYQPEEVFPIDGTPEQSKHVLWVRVDDTYYNTASRLKNMKLEKCINSTTCLSHKPKLKFVTNGASASIFVDNAAYRSFIRETFSVTQVDMESASVALVCYQQRVPFIVIRALSNLAGGGSSEDSEEAETFASLVLNNSVKVVVEFVKLLPASSLSSFKTKTSSIGRVRLSEDFADELFEVQYARTRGEHFSFHKNLQCNSDLQGTAWGGPARPLDAQVR